MRLPAVSLDPALQIWLVNATAPTLPLTLTPAEQAQAARLRQPQHRRTWSAVRSALRQVLASALSHDDPLAIEFAHNPYGKPYLPGTPLRFNVSHSGDLGLIAISPTHEVGIDLEHHRPNVSAPEIFRRTFAPAEVEYLETLTGEVQRTAFYRLWVRKEAVIKALGQGLSCSLQSFNALSGSLPEVDVRLQDLIVPGKDYSAAVACRGTPKR